MSAGTVFAADFTPISATPAISPPSQVIVSPSSGTVVDWTGFYVGGQLSFGRADLDLDDGDAGEQDLDGAVGGLHAGYLHDFGHVVAGGELAYDWTNLEDDDEDGPDLAGGIDLDGVFRVGARVGYDAGRVLPYATVGYANATFSEELFSTSDDNANGYYFGAGVEYAVTDRVSVGAEVLRHEIDVDIDDLDTALTTVGVRASYRF